MRNRRNQALWPAFLKDRSESVFTELVHSHVDLVYGTALRILKGNVHQAMDVTQNVFIGLVQKSPPLETDASLAGWLYRHTHFTACKWIRSEQRRREREKSYQAMENDTAGQEEQVWERIQPHLELCLE